MTIHQFSKEQRSDYSNYKMKIFVIFLSILIVVAAFETRPNVLFKFVEEKNASLVKIIYQLIILEDSEILRFLDEKFDIAMTETFFTVPKKLRFKEIYFTDKDTGAMIYKSRLDSFHKKKTSNDTYKYRISQSFRKEINLCSPISDCFGVIKLLNFVINEEKICSENDIKYSQIDAYFTICTSRNSCYVALSNYEETQYLFFFVLFMVGTLNATVIFCALKSAICNCSKKMSECQKIWTSKV